MKNINFIKRAILDVIFAVLLFTIYKKNVISMMYHEVAGLTIFGIMLIHLIFNRKWLLNQTTTLVSKSSTMNSKVLFINDICLIISFVIITISGIFISKKLFHFEGFMWVKQWHYFFAMLSLILLGVHFGLHDKFISLVFGDFKILGKYKDVIIWIVLIAISIFGLIMIFKGDFARYILMPFKSADAMQHVGHGAGQGMRNGMGKGMGTGTISFIKILSMGMQSFSIIVLFATITKFISMRLQKVKMN